MVIPMTEPIKRRRRPVISETGRLELQRQRQRLAREEAALGERLVLEHLQAKIHREKLKRQHNPEDAAVQRGIIRRVAAVLASENVMPIFDVEPAGHVKAWTDFSQIVVRYKMEDDIRLLSAKLRSLLYHEGGHMRWTMPFPKLKRLWLNEMREQDPTFRSIYTSEDMRQLQRAWNVLEDQRMETAVVSDSPGKARFFVPMIMTEFVRTPNQAAANYPVLIWRRYLPKHIRRGARAAFVTKNGETIAKALEACVSRYIKASDVLTMWACVEEMHSLLLSIKPMDLPDMGHDSQQDNTQITEDDLEIPIDPTMDDEDEGEDSYGSLLDEQQGSSDEPAPMPLDDDDIEDENDEDEADETEHADSGGAGREADETEDDDDDDDAENFGTAPVDSADDDDDDDTDIDGGDSAGEHGETEVDHTPEEELTQEDLDEALADAEEERLEDSTIRGDVEAYHDALDTGTSALAPYFGGRETDPEVTAIADNLAADIEQAFHENTMDRMPAWVEGQRRGIVNVLRYVTRQPGDDEYFRQWTEDDQPGHNIAVSVLLDYSGSMNSATTALAQVGYACKVACQNLDIPCTVVLWDDHAKTLYDANERAEYVPTIGSAGSTNPDSALADLVNHRFDKKHHIVLIMTDGSWDSEWRGDARGRGSKRTLTHYVNEGMYMIGFGYGGGALAESMKAKGCPEAYTIKDLREIPRYLEQALIDMA